MAKWTADRNATPPMFHDFVTGKRKVTVRRIAGKWRKRNGKPVYQHHYQVVTRWIGIGGDALGPVFTSLRQAKRFVEERVGA